MDEICINGGKRLEGEINIQGSKNAVLPMIAASMLSKGVSILKGCPKIMDVSYMTQILECLGAEVWWEDHDLYLDCTNADGTLVPDQYVDKMRSSIIMAGVLIARNGKVQIGYPGGCVIGKRPIDIHKMVLEKMGANIQENQDHICAQAIKLTGTKIDFSKISVGATEQAILMAVTADGISVLKNCACEPEIKWLCQYLKTMGADISGEGSRTIIIQGKEKLRPGVMRVPPDRIVTGTYIYAAAITRGRIYIKNPIRQELTAVMQVFCKMGGQYEYKSGTLLIDSTLCGKPVSFLETEIYPGFPTDLQSQLMAVLAVSEGKSHIKETIFEDRFKIAKDLNQMGACIRIQENDAYIYGRKQLTGRSVYARELRGGAALVLAGLAAKGTTTVKGVSYIERGYESICEDLRILGAEIS